MSREPSNLIIRLRDVHKAYGSGAARTEVLRGVSLDVRKGEVVALVGQSGSGKSTLLNIVGGLDVADRGTIEVLGEDPRHFTRRTRERIGYMPQSFVLYPELTARENVNLMAALFGIGPLRRGRRVAEALELVDLTEAKDRRASDMSGGMQRRLELACALVHQPQLLFLDEPTAGIDPLLRTRIWHELDHLRREGATIIVTTQYVAEAEYCDAVALISGGRLIAHATPTDLRKMALGGELIEIGTSGPFDVRSLPPVEGVANVRQLGPSQLLVIAQDAGVASPRISAAISAAGGHVDYRREYRPTFVEVFAALVTSEAEARARTEPDAQAAVGDE